MKQDEIFERIDQERERQESIHPLWRGDNHGLVVLAEEVGEVAKALYEYSEAMHDETNSVVEKAIEAQRCKGDLVDETIQVAAVAVRWLENNKLPRNYIYERILAERKRQDELHPVWRGWDHGFVILYKQSGAVSTSLYNYEHHIAGSTEDGRDELMRVIIKVAAVCVRWLENMETS